MHVQDTFLKSWINYASCIFWNFCSRTRVIQVLVFGEHESLQGRKKLSRLLSPFFSPSKKPLTYFRINPIHSQYLDCVSLFFSSEQNCFLIHSADPQSRPVVIIIFSHVRPSVPTKTMFTTGETVGMAEWIIDDICLFLFKKMRKREMGQGKRRKRKSINKTHLDESQQWAFKLFFLYGFL